MAAPKITYEVKGLAEIVAKLDADLIGGPLRKGLTTSALLVQGEAQRLVPVDTGNLRRTITHRVDSAPVPAFAIVGTNAPYAEAAHDGRKAGKMPPVRALLGWARRHGLNPFLVARAIGRRGTKGRPFLTDALKKTRGEIDGVLGRVARDIESEWGK